MKAPGLLDRQALTRHRRFPTYRTLPFASVLRRLSLGFFMSLKGNGNSHYTPTQKILFDYSESPAAEMTTNLWMGRLRTVLGPVFTSTCRTRPSSPGKTSTTLPFDHLFLGRSLSKTRTISLTETLRQTWFHFWRICDTRMYSLLNRFQNSLPRC